METPPGRRVMVAVVTGQLGARIQAWREKYDAKPAARLPPHLTVCYRPPDAPLASLEAQVRHGFPESLCDWGPFSFWPIAKRPWRCRCSRPLLSTTRARAFSTAPTRKWADGMICPR